MRCVCLCLFVCEFALRACPAVGVCLSGRGGMPSWVRVHTYLEAFCPARATTRAAAVAAIACFLSFRSRAHPGLSPACVSISHSG